MNDAAAEILARRALEALDVGEPRAVSGLRRLPGRDCAPLSFAQRRVWFLEQLEPGLPVQNVARVLRFAGALDEEALARAIGTVVARHDALRTTVTAETGEPRQRIAPRGEIPLAIDALPAVSERREEEALARAAEEARRPFDLERGPLARALLIRVSGDLRFFVWTMHHIVSDATSISLFFRELAAAYRAIVGGERPVLPDLPVQYGDWAQWQQETATDAALAIPVRRALERLAGAPPVLELPTDRPRGAHQTFEGGRVRRTVSAETAADLRALARRNGMTPFMVLLAAFDLLISRWTGGEDVVAGTPMSGRDRLETEGLIGLFVNMLVLRADCSGDPTLSRFLARVRDGALEAFDDQELPFEKLVEAIRPERLLSRTPVFQLMFNFHGDLDAAPSFPGLAVAVESIDNGAAPFDLNLMVAEEGEGTVCLWSYNRDLFDAETVERIASQYAALLDAFARGADRRISELEMLPPEEREMLRRWSAGIEPGEESASTVADLLAERFRERPEAIAVEAGGERLTARDLDRESAAIAAALRAAGAGPETIVAVLLDRTARLPAALLGVVRSGAAFLPLDPAHPGRRLRELLDDSGAAVVVTDATHAGVFPGKRAILVDRPLPSASVPDGGAFGSNAAYVLHTSGSTGKPKGVVVEHGSLVNLVRSMLREPGVDASDVWVAVTPITFDIAIAEIFVPLAAGAKVAIAAAEDAADPARLARLLDDAGATILQATPATWQMLVGDGWRGKRDLRILSGGEALPAALARELRERGREVWNLYGPTETTIWSAIARVGAGDSGPTAPIGPPIARTSLRVVDARLRDTPIGVPGELVIGGAGVAREYLGRPAETAERFVPDPLGRGRLYRTGDRARRRRDGTIEFLGRFDDQLKIRGFRVEPAEVEAAIREDPRVAAAVVVATGEGAARALAAFVRTTGDRDPAALRDRLRDRLPEPMVPTRIAFVDAFPLTSSGKVDRRALAAHPPSPSPGGRAPGNATETLVARTWQDVLRLESVSVDQNFFEIGGHSLLATRVLARLRSAFAVDLPLRVLFERPTVADLAAEIVRRTAGGTR